MDAVYHWMDVCLDVRLGGLFAEGKQSYQVAAQ
jgi:hypothetical protein